MISKRTFCMSQKYLPLTLIAKSCQHHVVVDVSFLFTNTGYVRVPDVLQCRKKLQEPLPNSCFLLWEQPLSCREKIRLSSVHSPADPRYNSSQRFKIVKKSFPYNKKNGFSRGEYQACTCNCLKLVDYNRRSKPFPCKQRVSHITDFAKIGARAKTVKKANRTRR